MVSQDMRSNDDEDGTQSFYDIPIRYEYSEKCNDIIQQVFNDSSYCSVSNREIEWAPVKLVSSRAKRSQYQKPKTLLFIFTTLYIDF